MAPTAGRVITYAAPLLIAFGCALLSQMTAVSPAASIATAEPNTSELLVTSLPKMVGESGIHVPGATRKYEKTPPLSGRPFAPTKSAPLSVTATAVPKLSYKESELGLEHVG